MRLNFKQGAASFYIVAFSTLILLTIAMSFAAIIISQINRTMNDDLSQSAYDSAMAGVEDAKLAYYNYQDCRSGKATNSGSGMTCSEIVTMVEENTSCDVVGNILGRGGEGEVSIQETIGVQNNMEQAYTCVKMRTSLESYESTISASSPARVIRAKFDGVSADEIQSVEVSWYSDKNASENGINYSLFDGERVKFKQDNLVDRAKPPVISVGMVQTAGEFRFQDFDLSVGGQTNRGMVYLVPTGKKDVASKTVDKNYIGAFDTNSGMNLVGESGMIKSNEKTATNLPFGVLCSSNYSDGYMCSARIRLPKPIGGTRSDDTFVFVVALPYGQPTTDIRMEFFCSDTNTRCAERTVEKINEDSTEGETITGRGANLKDVQVEVDSTGRANDLYRRVQVRMDVGVTGGDNSGALSSIMGPLELSGEGSSSGSGSGGGSRALEKNTPVTCEWNFPNRGC